jgi:hypothetical protein
MRGTIHCSPWLRFRYSFFSTHTLVTAKMRGRCQSIVPRNCAGASSRLLRGNDLFSFAWDDFTFSAQKEHRK